MNPEELDKIEEDKKKLDSEQILHPEMITEVDEAAMSAEGMDNMSDDFHKDVSEDRDALPPHALDLPDSRIIQ